MHATLAQLEKLGRIQAQQREAIATKANDFDTQERHEALVAETKEGAKSLHDRAEQLGTSINAIEEQLAQLSNLTQHKAEAHEVDEVLRQNDAVQGQVSALKGELEGTLRTLETWIVEQNARKAHTGIALQQRKEPTAAAAGGGGGGGGGGSSQLV